MHLIALSLNANMSTYRIKSAKDIEPALRKMRVFSKKLRPIFERALWQSVLKLEQEVVERTPVGTGGAPTGHLRGSIHSEVVSRPRILLGTVGTPAEYALAVEEGTRPHFPPPSALVDWVHFQLGVPMDRALTVAFLVARAISKKGTKGHFMFRDGWDAALPLIKRYMKNAHKRAVRRTFK